jgi:DNA-binding GntR family transcriptional regulator
MIRLSKQRNLAERITDRLFEAVLHGELKPGERIIETKMARQLGVGQSTFREALQALEHRGLVTKDRHTFITKHTLQDIEVLFAVRLELEPLAAALACERLTSAHFRQLELYCDEMEKARQRLDFVTVVKNDLKFHELIWQTPQVSALYRILNLVLPPLFVFLFIRHSDALSNQLNTWEEATKRGNDDHSRLIGALKQRDPVLVKEIFREVTQRSIQAMRALGAEPASTTTPKPHR